jgi:hypothetical protein
LAIPRQFSTVDVLRAPEATLLAYLREAGAARANRQGRTQGEKIFSSAEGGRRVVVRSAFSIQPKPAAQTADNWQLSTDDWIKTSPPEVSRRINNLDIIHVANNRF